ncbi:MAG: photosynthetic complex assembly protein PuhC [Congregibacter sp.]
MDNSLSQSNNTPANDPATRYFVMGLAAIALMVLVATLVARLTGYTAETIPDTPVLDMREIGFRDQPGGIVVAYEWHSEQELLRLAPGEGSFLRGVVRSLVRQRAGLSGDLAVPFQLSRHSDGRMVISDPATGERIDLVAFGPDNYATFGPLLDIPLAAATAGDAW